MGFFSDILNKIRQNPEDQAQAGGILPAVNMANPAQGGNAITNAINTAVGTPTATPITNMNGSVSKSNLMQPPVASPASETMQSGTLQPPQPQTPEQSVLNGIKNKIGGSKLNPHNWSDNTKNSLLSVLNGALTSNYDPNLGFWGSLGEGAVKGRQNYINYNNTKKALGNYGLDTSGMSPFADYSQMTPDKLVTFGIKNQQNATRQNIANAKDNTARLKIIMDGLKNGTMEPTEAAAQAKIYGIDFGKLQESNQTVSTDSEVKLDEKRGKKIDSDITVNGSKIKKINSDIKVNTARIEQIKANIKQNQQKIGILQQRVNRGNATSGDRAVLNQLNIQNKKLLIEQNTLINQGMKQQMGGGSGNGSGRPVGQKGGKVF